MLNLFLRAFYLATLGLTILGGFTLPALAEQVPEPVKHACEVVDSYAHNDSSFTQGLVKHGDWVYESSGKYKKSFISRYQLDGEKKQQVELPGDIFAEGITLVDDSLYLISWQSGQAWVLDRETLTPTKNFHYDGEGWGLTHDGQQLIMSNGSALLRFYQPDTFELTDTRWVRLNGERLDNLNELEFVDGIVWANRWYSDTLYGIDPDTGDVVASMDCGELKKRAGIRGREQVLNGIAYDGDSDTLLVTGKYWPRLFRIKRPPVERPD